MSCHQLVIPDASEVQMVALSVWEHIFIEEKNDCDQHNFLTNSKLQTTKVFHKCAALQVSPKFSLLSQLPCWWWFPCIFVRLWNWSSSHAVPKMFVTVLYWCCAIHAIKQSQPQGHPISSKFSQNQYCPPMLFWLWHASTLRSNIGATSFGSQIIHSLHPHKPAPYQLMIDDSLWHDYWYHF